MYSKRDSYLVTDSGSYLAMTSSMAVIGSGVSALSLFVGGTELILAGFLYFFNMWMLGFVESYDVNNLSDFLGWFILMAVYTLSWGLLIKNLTAKRLMPTLLLLSFIAGYYSYGWLMGTSAFDRDNWFVVGILCVLIFFNCYSASVAMVTTRRWQPDNIYYFGDDPSWAFLWNGGRIKAWLVAIGGAAYLWLLFAVPILLALYTQRWIPQSWEPLFMPALASIKFYQWLF